MAEDMIRESHPLYDRAQVRMFTLADYVADETSGKLYISGAGLEWVGVPVRPNPDGDGQLLSCHVVLRLAFPRTVARETHIIEVLVRNDDGTPAGPDALFKVEMHFDLARTPPAFTELSGSSPVQIVNYPLTAEPDGVIFLHLVVDEVLVSRLPVQLLPVES